MILASFLVRKSAKIQLSKMNTKKLLLLIIIIILSLTSLLINTNAQEKIEYPVWLRNHPDGDKVIELVEADGLEVERYEEEYREEFGEDSLPYS